MERLTEKDRYSHDYKIQAKNLNSHCVAKDKKGYVTYYGQHVDKLAEYEDAEEQGLLLQFPCKVGDTVYYIEDNVINEFIVYSFDIRPLQEFVCNYEGIRLNFKNFGKTVFLTQAEAEQKLKNGE